MRVLGLLALVACLGTTHGERADGSAATTTETMRAARLHAAITPTDLSGVTVDDIDVPMAGVGEVLIAVHASSVNPVDYKLAEQGAYLVPRPLGGDVSGVVVACGSSACEDGDGRLAVGAEVWADVGYSGLYPGASGNGAWAEVSRTRDSFF